MPQRTSRRTRGIATRPFLNMDARARQFSEFVRTWQALRMVKCFAMVFSTRWHAVFGKAAFVLVLRQSRTISAPCSYAGCLTKGLKLERR